MAGFTLIELLVVIAIIGAMTSLRLPAVQAAREATRRMNCSNRQRQLTLAIHNYESTFRVMPPGSYDTGPDGYSWGLAAYLLPFFEEAAAYETIDFAQPNCGADLKGLQANNFCPSALRSGESLLSGPLGPLPYSGDCGLLFPADYLGMAGSNDIDTSNTYTDLSTRAGHEVVIID